MNKFAYLLLLIFATSCDQGKYQTEKDYIGNLEEKNRILEKELKELKINSDSKQSSTSKVQNENSADFFTIGSTEDEVIEIMGEPTTYLKTAPEAKKFLFELSTVYFYQGKVISYDNFGDNLKVRVKK